MANAKQREEQRSSDYSTGWAVGYVYAQTEHNINAVLAQAGDEVTGRDIAAKLGELLLSKAGGSVLDGAERLPQVRGEAATRDEVTAGSKAVHVHARHNKPLKPIKKKSAAESYWSKMSPLQRKREMQRRGMVGKGSKRWVKANKAKANKSKSKVTHVMSAAGRKKISMTQKARWAKIRAEARAA